jgi:hypothetical protein
LTEGGITIVKSRKKIAKKPPATQSAFGFNDVGVLGEVNNTTYLKPSGR